MSVILNNIFLSALKAFYAPTSLMHVITYFMYYVVNSFCNDIIHLLCIDFNDLTLFKCEISDG